MCEGKFNGHIQQGSAHYACGAAPVPKDSTMHTAEQTVRWQDESHLGLPLGLEAPVMTPNGVTCLSFLSRTNVHVRLCADILGVCKHTGRIKDGIQEEGILQGCISPLAPHRGDSMSCVPQQQYSRPCQL